MKISEAAALDLLVYCALPIPSIGARNARLLQKKGLARPVRWKGDRPKVTYLQLTNAGAKVAGFRSLKKAAPRRRCWNFRVKPESFKGRRLCYRLARRGTDLCPTCEIGGMDPG